MKKKKPECFYQELVAKYVCKQFDCVAVRELNFGGPKFDVVGFSQYNDEFYIIECKCTKSAVGVGQTFGQILAYKTMILEAGETFLYTLSEKIVKDRIRKAEFAAATARFTVAGKIPVRFFVALLDEACRPEMLDLIKKDLKGVGIIRIDKYDHCKNYIKRSGKKDFQLCASSQVVIPIAKPIRPYLKRVLESRHSNGNVTEFVGRLDGKIRKMKNSITAEERGDPPYKIVYRSTKNFVELNPCEEHLRVSIKEGKRWKHKNIIKTTQIPRLLPKIRLALDHSMN